MWNQPASDLKPITFALNVGLITDQHSNVHGSVLLQVLFYLIVHWIFAFRVKVKNKIYIVLSEILYFIFYMNKTIC